jgi:hypothetical protein
MAEEDERLEDRKDDDAVGEMLLCEGESSYTTPAVLNATATATTTPTIIVLLNSDVLSSSGVHSRATSK